MDADNACIMDQIFFLDEIHLLSAEMFFDAQAAHFISTTKYVASITYVDAGSRPDCKDWRGAFDSEMNRLKKRNIFSVADRPGPAYHNQLGTIMVQKEKITAKLRKCRLCLHGDWQKEVADFF